MQLTASVIKDEKDIHKAKCLLYDYYVKELKWQIPRSNPSGIKIEQIGNRKKIVDDFDDFAVWFSIADGEDLVACARLCNNDLDGKLEVERYSEAQEKLYPVLNLKGELNLIELNREAILTSHPANRIAHFLLLHLVFKYCLDNNYSILTTSNLKEWTVIYENVHFPRLNSCQFRYSDSELIPVDVYLAKANDLKRILKMIEYFLKSEEKNAQTLCVS